MVAAFGSGAMFSLVSGMGGPNQAANAVTSGLFFALVQGGLFQVSIQQAFFYCNQASITMSMKSISYFLLSPYAFHATFSLEVYFIHILIEPVIC